MDKSQLSWKGVSVSPSFIAFTFCFIIRLFAIALVELGPAEVFGTKLDAVPDRYDLLGQNIVHHGVFGFDADKPTAARGPAYPFLIGIVQWLLGTNLIWVRIAVSLVDSLACLTLFVWASSFVSRRHAIAVSIVYALYPPFIWTTLRMWNDTLIVLAALLVLVGASRFLASPSIFNSILFGVVIGAALYVKELFTLYPLLVACISLFTWKGVTKVRWASLNILAIVTMLAVVSPWAIRNYVQFDRFVLVQSLGGFNYSVGSHWVETSSQTGRTYTAIAEEAIEIGKVAMRNLDLDEDQLYEPPGDEHFKKVMVEDFSNRPAFVLRKLFFFLPRFWYTMDDQQKTSAGISINAGLYILGLVGIYSLSRKGHGVSTSFLLLIGTVTYFNFLHSLIVAVFRYALPVMPLVILSAVEGISFIKERLARNDAVGVTGAP